MNLIPMPKFSSQLRADALLPWNVRDEAGNLLLARGSALSSDAEIERLRERGVFIDADEAQVGAPSESATGLGPGNLFDRWGALQNKVGALLRNPQQPNFLSRVKDLTDATATLADSHTDQLIFAMVRNSANKVTSYGATHSLHAAVTCGILTRKLVLEPGARSSLLGAALTMNLAMAELQGQLAAKGGTLSEAQKITINTHPDDSAELLRQLGLQDLLWLKIVTEHHEQPASKGYPNKIAAPCELSQMLRLVDIFIAKHSARGNRPAMPARLAAQSLYQQSNGHEFASMLIKEFGVFPPGCFVKIATGELAVVVRRGKSATTPLAAVLLNRNGDAVTTPSRRDTANPEFAVLKTIPDNLVRVPVYPERLYDRSEL